MNASDLPAAHRRTPKHWEFPVDLPANHLGPVSRHERRVKGARLRPSALTSRYGSSSILLEVLVKGVLGPFVLGQRPPSALPTRTAFTERFRLKDELRAARAESFTSWNPRVS